MVHAVDNRPGLHYVLPQVIILDVIPLNDDPDTLSLFIHLDEAYVHLADPLEIAYEESKAWQGWVVGPQNVQDQMF